MTSWPRAIFPVATSGFFMPAAAESWSQSGKAQHLMTGQRGRTWTETLQPYQPASIAGRQLAGFINRCILQGLQFDIDYYNCLTTNGGGTGAPTVNGANQAGTSLITAGWTGTDPVMREGDLLRLPGLSLVFDLAADAPNRIAGAVTLTLNPPIVVGSSPTNGGLLTYTGVRLNAFLFGNPGIPDTGKNGWVVGAQLTFREAV